MAEQFISCPSCSKRIPLTEAITSRIEEKLRLELRKEYDGIFKEREKEWEENLSTERSKLEKQIRARAEEGVAIELKDLKSQLVEREQLLNELRGNELELRRKTRALQERENNLKLEVVRQIDQERKKIWEEARANTDTEHQLKEAEHQKVISDFQRQILELKRRLEQGSQQMQGEVLELELEDVLHQTFRFDEIEAVAKGVRGGDVTQKVLSKTGNHCGTILWETKRTKNWSDTWIQKAKDDQRRCKADIVVIVSASLPQNFRAIEQRDGVWVTDFACAIGLAIALRDSLLHVAQARAATSGKSSKMELLYNYLTGPEFKQRLEAMIEVFVAMKEELDSERRSTEKMLARREKQIEKVILSMAGLHGDLQGIVGSSLPPIRLLEATPRE